MEENYLTEQQAKQLFNQLLKGSFASKRIGDTPTEDLQLVNKKYCDANGGSYSGLANTDGTASSLPTGWSIAGGIAGQCTITHNLGNTAYSVVASIQSTLAVTIVNIYNITSTSFDVKTINQTGAITWTNTNTAFFFNLIPH